jgi:hypothetical protein
MQLYASLSYLQCMARTIISVDQQVFERFSSQAKRQGKTIYALANEALSTVANISSEGGKPAELYPLWKTFGLLRQMDAVILPSDFVDELVAKLCAENKPALLNMFATLGASVAGSLRMSAPGLDDLTELGKEMTHILPIKHLDIMENGGDAVEMDLIGVGRREVSTECTAEFAKAIFRGYGYTVTRQELSVGTLRIWASKKGS